MREGSVQHGGHGAVHGGPRRKDGVGADPRACPSAFNCGGCALAKLYRATSRATSGWAPSSSQVQSLQGRKQGYSSREHSGCWSCNPRPRRIGFGHRGLWYPRGSSHTRDHCYGGGCCRRGGGGSVQSYPPLPVGKPICRELTEQPPCWSRACSTSGIPRCHHCGETAAGWSSRALLLALAHDAGL
jgi:hypothetical protein